MRTSMYVQKKTYKHNKRKTKPFSVFFAAATGQVRPYVDPRADPNDALRGTCYPTCTANEENKVH